MVIRNSDGTATSYDYRETAPEAAFRDMFLDDSGNYAPDVARKGHLASGIPGSVAGMLKAHSDLGNLSREEVLRPAIELANNGFSITHRQARRLNGFRNRFSPYAGTMKYFAKSDSTDQYREGDLLVQEDLGAVLERISASGRDGFYKGITADLIVDEMKLGNGIISHADLESYEAIERKVVEFDYRGHNVITMAPPSSGGIALAQLLNSVEPFDIGLMGYGSSATAHLIGESMRRVYADRAEWLGDPGYFDIPVDGLIEKNYSNKRMEAYHPSSATPSTEVSFGAPAPVESMETTHYSVVDSDGNAVSVTTTINSGYGSLVVVDGAGFFLNNEMDDFSSKPGTPNMFGLVGSEANSISPGKRMLSSMTPTIVEDKDGELFMVVGTPGGATIITTVFQVILNVIDHGMNIQEAVAAPRIHHQWLPDTYFHEPFAFSHDVKQNLIARGWNLSSRTGYVGSADAIVVTTTDGVRSITGGADPRGDNTAIGF